MSRLSLLGILAAGLFWVLLAYGWWQAELTKRTIAVFVVLWAAGMAGFPYLPIGRGAFVGFVALMDVVLILMVFKKDIRI